MQVIEFPNALQRTLKLYVDWDKKLSDVRTRTNFLQTGDQESVVQRRADVEAIRKLALGTPAAVMRLLKAMGCSSSSSMHGEGNDVRVIVKEGTRPLTQGEQDWKISFHFIFQIVVSSAQFRLVYHHMAELIRTTLENLAAALRLVDTPDKDRQMQMETDAMRDPLHGALVGMDMHPRQNVFQVRFLEDLHQTEMILDLFMAPQDRISVQQLIFAYMQKQGLACLGSKKSEDAPRSMYVGAMRINTETCEWQWDVFSSANNNGSDSDDTKDSTASTVAFFDTHDDGNDKENMLLARFGTLVQQWMECSILMPSSTCGSLHVPDSWKIVVPAAAAAAATGDFPLAGILQRMTLVDNAVSSIISPSKQKKRPPTTTTWRPSEASGSGVSPSSGVVELWKRLLFEGRGLQWFRDALGGLCVCVRACVYYYAK